jgi:hypothetical protein
MDGNIFLFFATNTMSFPIVPICPCGCKGSRSTSECQFKDAGRTSTELLCSGSAIFDVQTLQEVWNKHNCRQEYTDILFRDFFGRLQYDPCNLARIQADTDNLLTAYVGFGLDFTSDTSSPKYNIFQQTLIDLCSSNQLPGGCDLFLTNYCGQRTRAEIGADAALAKMCGCYAPPSFPTSTVVPECDPICHLVETAQIAQPCDGKINTCSNTVCVIDDVNINLINTQTATAFQQICPACDNSQFPCTCIISGTDVVDTLNKAGVGAQYLQFCGKNAQCFRDDKNGKLTQVQCPVASDFTGDTYKLPLPIIILIVVGIAIFLIILVVWAARRNRG